MSAETIAGLISVAALFVLSGYVIGYGVALIRIHSRKVEVTLVLGDWWDEWALVKRDVPKD